MMNDFRYALRTLRRSPGLTVSAISSLALGVGATTAIFSLTNAIVLRSLPVEKPNELILLRYVSKKGNIFDAFSYPDYVALRDQKQVLAGLSAVAPVEVNLASEEAGERVAAELVSGNYFGVLGVRPRLGRLIQPEDDTAGGRQRVCVISHGLWQRRFGSAPDVMSRKVQINGRPYSILGVTPQSFDGTSQGARPQIFLPLMMAAEVFNRPGNPKVQPEFAEWTDWLQMVGRRNPEVSISRAEAVLDARFSHLPLAERDATFEMSDRHGVAGQRARLLLADGRQGFDGLRFRLERPLLLLLVLVALLLVIACANVANLLVARASGQRRQIAIRLALGAGRWSLTKQQLAESLLLAAAGAAGGLLLSIWISELLVRLGPPGSEIDARPDLTVLGFLIVIGCLTVLLFGIIPALGSAGAGIEAVLRSDSAGGGRRRGWLPKALVMVQVALSMALLASAGLFVRSLHNLRSIPTGFRPENVVVASLNPGVNGYPAARSRALFENLTLRAETIPGVRSASASMVSPLSGNMWLYSVAVPGYRAAPGEFPMVYVNAVGPAFFATIGSPLVRGREFTLRDREGSPCVAVINERMAKKYWPGQDPVGRHFTTAALDNKDTEVVGVVRDSLYADLREQKQEILYVPLLQGDFRSATLHLLVSGDPAPVFRELRSRAQALDAQVPLYGMKTLEAQIGGRLSTPRTLAAVSTIMGMLAVVLAMVGLYSVLANLVAQRTREIGIRLALGAAPPQVIGLVVRDTLRMVSVGVGAGVLVALSASRWIASFLYGVKPQDALTYAAISALVVAAGLLAAYVPSRRASRVDPMVVLRYE